MKVTVRSIGEAAAEFYDVPYSDLAGNCQKRRTAFVRHVWFYLARKKFNHSLSHIGRVSDRHHTAVMHGANRIESYDINPINIKWMCDNATHREAYKRSKIDGTTPTT